MTTGIGALNETGTSGIIPVRPEPSWSSIMPSPDELTPEERERRIESMVRKLDAVQTHLATGLVTGNPVFFWRALELLMAPDMAENPIVFPEELRTYFHTAALGIRNAATEPPNAFGASALEALRLSEGRGSSVAKSYARSQGFGEQILAFEVLKQRHGADKAETMVAKAVSLDESTVHQRLWEARALYRAVRQAMSRTDVEPVPDERFTKLPDGFLLEFFKGSPDMAARTLGLERHGRKWRMRSSSGRSGKLPDVGK